MKKSVLFICLFLTSFLCISQISNVDYKIIRDERGIVQSVSFRNCDDNTVIPKTADDFFKKFLNVGQVHGNQFYFGNTHCSQPRAEYGRFNLSWNGGGTDASRLSNWLDPTGSGALTTNTSVSPYISGLTQVCSSGTIFHINNLPSGCSCSWDKSDNININSYGSYIYAYANGNGNGWIEASFCGITLRYPVWVGTPIVSVTGPYEGCPNTQYTFQAHTEDPANTDPFSYSWTISPYDGYISTSNGGNYAAYAYITFYNVYSVNGYDVMARAQNSCGTGEYGETNIWIHDCYYFMLSPNPASESVTISRKSSANSEKKASSLSSEELTKVFSIKVLDIYGSMHYSSTRSGEQFTIPTQNLKEGNYFVQISDKGKVVSNLQLVIKR